MNDIATPGIGGAVLAVIGIWSVVGIGIYVWYLWSLARLFPYLGLPSAHGWIPVWNQWRLVERGGLPGWLVLLGLVPGLSIVVLVVSIIAIHRINQEHGEGAGMTVLGALIAPLWATLLGSRLRDRGYGTQPQAAASAYGAQPVSGWQPPAQQQGFVEYGPDGQVYPLLGAPQVAPAEAAPTAVGNGWAMPPVPPMAPEANAAPPAPFAAPSAVSGAPGAPAVPATPAANDPWSLGTTVDDNFERLAQEAPVARDGGFGPGSDSRPFAWPEPQLHTPPSAPPAAAPPAAAPPVVAPPVYVPAPAVDPAPVVEPVQPEHFAPTVGVVPAVPPAPAAPVFEPMTPGVVPSPAAVPVQPVFPIDEVDATVVTDGASAPIDIDDESDRTIVVSRKTTWVLELPDGNVLELPGDDVIVGRRPAAVEGAAALTVPDSTRTLSKSHARLRRIGESWTVEDLNSTNGVFVIHGESQIEAMPGVQIAATEHLVIGTLEVRLRAA